MNLDNLTYQIKTAFVFTTLLGLLSGLFGPQAVRGGQKKSPAVQSRTASGTGAAVYAKQCASCHGAKGEGTKKYSKSLTGDRSIGELTKYIAKSMPPGPRPCSAKDAPLVSTYIYDSFYSPLAQARNSPARISLSRLTVRQFRNSIADLIGSFRQGDQPDGKHGLQGDYFKARRLQQSDRLLQRVDPEVRFDFGQSGPVADQFDPHQFSIRWQGSVLAPDTGDYEFVVHTDHALRLYVDDFKQPLVDAWVKSGSGTEFRGSIYLLGGRLYPIRLDFSKSTQGVDDTDKQKNRPISKASISLCWRRPKQAEEVIPQRCLVPKTIEPVFVPNAPFPPDDRSIGYERGTSVSKAWDEATTSAALETASFVSNNLRDLSGTPDAAVDREARIHAFCRTFVERAFRRPLTKDLEQTYVEKQLKTSKDLAIGVKRVVLLALKSPRFLYREAETANPDAYQVASRLSYGLWDSLPDKELLKEAAANQLTTREQVRSQAQRMAADPRAWFKLREFLLQWLKVDQSPELAKDAKRYAGFDDSVASDLRTSLELFLENTVWNDKSDYRELMVADKVYLNGRLSKLYGVNLPPDAPFQPVSLDPAERSGVLTQPYIMASFAYTDNSSPIHRGVLLYRNMLGRTLKPPPAAFAPLPAGKVPNLTTRERVSLQTKPAACAGCHAMINPLGFTLERFDAIGRFRDTENGQKIDATGAYESRTGQTVKFAGVRDLGKYLARSEEAHAAFVEKLFQHMVKQPIRAYGAQALPNLEKSFEANDCSIRKLMVEIMAESALKR